MGAATTGGRHRDLDARLGDVSAAAHAGLIAVAGGDEETVAARAGAARAEVSPPTVLRFAQSLGYEGFTDLQVALRAELTARSNGPITRLPSAPAADGLLGRLLRQAHCCRIRVARCTCTVAGSRHLLAMHLGAHLEQLRSRVRLLADPTGRDLGAMIELTRRDVVVLFDYHRYQRSAADLAGLVHRAGAVLLITDDLACPVAPEAEVVLAASSTVDTTYQSMAAGFLLTELLIPLGMDAVGEPARTRMALWEDQRNTELLACSSSGRPLLRSWEFDELAQRRGHAARYRVVNTHRRVAHGRTRVAADRMQTDLTAILLHGRGVLVEQSKRFFARHAGQQQRHLPEAQFVDGPPVVGVGGSAELRQRDVVAGALANLTDAFGQVLRR
jgi:DNA-binding MurR/RpiR family transcriptional regulator